MLHKKDWLTIPALLIGLGMTVMGCSQSSGSPNTSGTSQPAEMAKPDTGGASGPNVAGPPPGPPSPPAAAPSPSPETPKPSGG